MDIRNRLIGPCATSLPTHENVVLDLNALVIRLLLFDTYILQSIDFKEIPHLVKALGFEGTLVLLSSGAIRFHCDAPRIAQVGQDELLRQQKNVLPLGSYSFSQLNFDQKRFISNRLKNVQNTQGLSLKQVIKLKKAVVSALEAPSLDTGLIGLKQLEQDLVNNSELIKSTTTLRIYKKFGIKVTASDFSIRLHKIDDKDFQVETDIGNIFSLNEEEVHKLIEQALLGVAGLNLRFEEMKTYSALSGCLSDEASLFEDKLKFLANIYDPKTQERRFERVIEIKGFPEISLDSDQKKLNIEKLIEIRQSKECREFREWLHTIDSASDAEIAERLGSIQSKLSPLVHGGKGKLLRFLISTGIGLVPGLGTVMGAGVGAIDMFFLEKILPYSGIAAFVNQLYPSIFINSDR